MSEFDPLRAYLQRRAPFTAKELDALEEFFVPATRRPGEFLQRAGEPVRYAAFVAKGCLRSYVVDAKGQEVILEFAPDDWWLGDRTFLTGGTTCECFIDAIVDSELLLFDQASHQRMVACIPTFAAMFRIAFQKYAAEKDRRIINALSMSVEERYLEFLQRYPGIAQRVPQRMLASYLGVTPETLSRVRRHLSQK
jgi:CRP/FNR family transcriptional regulator, anaerobic regulatory protein